MRTTLVLFLVFFSFTSFAFEANITKISKSGEKILLDSSTDLAPGEQVNVFDGAKFLGKATMMKSSEDKSAWALDGWLAIPGLRNVRMVKTGQARRGIASVKNDRSDFEADWGNRRPRQKNQFERAW